MKCHELWLNVAHLQWIQLNVQSKKSTVNHICSHLMRKWRPYFHTMKMNVNTTFAGHYSSCKLIMHLYCPTNGWMFYTWVSSSEIHFRGCLGFFLSATSPLNLSTIVLHQQHKCEEELLVDGSTESSLYWPYAIIEPSPSRWLLALLVRKCVNLPNHWAHLFELNSIVYITLM